MRKSALIKLAAVLFLILGPVTANAFQVGSSGLSRSNITPEDRELVERLLGVPRDPVTQAAIGSTGVISVLLFGLYLWLLWQTRRSHRHQEDLGLRQDDAEQVLKAFHLQALEELKRNTDMTRAMSVMGAGVIFLGAFLGLIGLAPVGVASVVGGAIIEAVGFLFHKQTNLSRERVIRIENDLMRMKLAKTINDASKRDETIASIIAAYAKSD